MVQACLMYVESLSIPKAIFSRAAASSVEILEFVLFAFKKVRTCCATAVACIHRRPRYTTPNSQGHQHSEIHGRRNWCTTTVIQISWIENRTLIKRYSAGHARTLACSLQYFSSNWGALSSQPCAGTSLPLESRVPKPSSFCPA